MQIDSIRALVQVSSLLVAVVACSSSGSPSNGSSSTRDYASEAHEACVKNPAHRLNQPSDPTKADPNRCERITACLNDPTLSPGTAAKAVSCIQNDVGSSKSCTQDDVSEVGALRPNVVSFQASCKAKRDACPGDPATPEASPWDIAWCKEAPNSLSDATLAAMKACFDKGCADVKGCLVLPSDPLECIDGLF